jgi:16S rRNA C967 or C1407 C5-methylase (RsmB/RsmF family)/NOL1/NOP2/fmu family ribosome biogenesis protein
MTLPEEFIRRTRSLLADTYDLLEEALLTEAPVSVRINHDKGLQEAGAERVPWCETGYYLPRRIPFTFDPLFHAGAYYVQEASSMFLEQAVKACVREPVTCLDLCAAPGGKSTHLCSILPVGSLLVCNEVIRSRSYILAENVIKWGNPYTIVCNNDPSTLGGLTHFFDLIVADLPCSGEGMFRKDVHSADEWSVAAVRLCAARQQRIIRDIWNALKPGGFLIYSTCTYNTEENEDNIHYIIEELGAGVLPVPVDESWKISGSVKYNEPACRFFPHKTRGEGFFLSVLQKPAEATAGPAADRLPAGKRKAAPPPPAGLSGWLRQAEEFRIDVSGETIQAFPLLHADSYSFLSKRLHIISSGVCLGELKGKDVQPAHALAMSRALCKEAFVNVELSGEEAIRYLRKEALSLPGDKGYMLATYKGLPLGFVKQLSNRANNLYPQEWRIRSNKIPGERTDIAQTPGIKFTC